MPKLAFLATLGQRPEAITMALDLLNTHYTYDVVGVLHTDEEKSGIHDALCDLRTALPYEFPDVKMAYHELCDTSATPIIDIEHEVDAEAYYIAMLEIFQHYLSQGYHIHLLISGGRKAMSVYATLAASLAFTAQDKVYVILSSKRVLDSGAYRIDPTWRDEVQLVNLPFVPSPWLPGSIASRTVEDILALRQSPRARFLSKLTDAEAQLADVLSTHRYEPMDTVAERLGKSPRTIENQLGSIYSKMEIFYEGTLNRKQKRQALLDILDQPI